MNEPAQRRPFPLTTVAYWLCLVVAPLIAAVYFLASANPRIGPSESVAADMGALATDACDVAGLADATHTNPRRLNHLRQRRHERRSGRLPFTFNATSGMPSDVFGPVVREEVAMFEDFEFVHDWFAEVETVPGRMRQFACRKGDRVRAKFCRTSSNTASLHFDNGTIALVVPLWCIFALKGLAHAA